VDELIQVKRARDLDPPLPFKPAMSDYA